MVTVGSKLVAMESNLISKAIEIVGLANLARTLGVTYQAIRKWEAKGRLPRTEWTGETNYAALIEVATEGQVPRTSLLAPAAPIEKILTTTRTQLGLAEPEGV